MVRPTEENNSLSANIDVVPLDQMVNVFAQVDYQLFQAWPGTGKRIFFTRNLTLLHVGFYFT